jgi:hypothetical protein
MAFTYPEDRVGFGIFSKTRTNGTAIVFSHGAFRSFRALQPPGSTYNGGATSSFLRDEVVARAM